MGYKLLLNVPSRLLFLSFAKTHHEAVSHCMRRLIIQHELFHNIVSIRWILVEYEIVCEDV